MMGVVGLLGGPEKGESRVLKLKQLMESGYNLTH